MIKKMLYVSLGFVCGFLANSFLIPELSAQYGGSSTGSFQETSMQPNVPAEYGKLIAVSGIDLYFQADNGNVYIIKPRTDTTLSSGVTVIKRD